MLKLSRRIENAAVQHQEDATIHESDVDSDYDPVCEQLETCPYSSASLEIP